MYYGETLDEAIPRLVKDFHDWAIRQSDRGWTDGCDDPDMLILDARKVYKHLTGNELDEQGYAV